MDLYNSIAQRKSVRQYNTQPLQSDVLIEIENAIASFDSLYPDTPVSHRIVPKTKGPFNIVAPHYIIISGQGKTGEYENTGFKYQQLALWMDAKDIGCVWLAGAKDINATSNDIITIAFGRPDEQLHRTAEEFKRKPIEKITNAVNDERIQAVRYAPSGINLQPWFFEVVGGIVRVYKEKPKPPVSLMYKHYDLDMGLALCHYAIACKHLGMPFSFRKYTEVPEKKGFIPFGIIS